MQCIHHVLCGNRKRQNATSVDCFNYIQSFSYTYLFLSSEAMHCNVCSSTEHILVSRVQNVFVHIRHVCGLVTFSHLFGATSKS